MKYIKQIRFIAIGLLITLTLHFSTYAFTQFAGGIFPIGHEWITRISIFDLIGNDPLSSARKDDPRNNFPINMRAKNVQFSTEELNYIAKLKKVKAEYVKGASSFAAEYDFIRSAIIGVRWVDLAGINVVKDYATAATTKGKISAFDAVAQEASELQQDHFMRNFSDIGNEGGFKAAKRSQKRFIEHFVNAAMAKSQRIKVWDGGPYSLPEIVDYNYFLFGRASHLFQDSFSPDHVVRSSKDGYQKIRQVKSYICNKGSEQHAHDVGKIVNYQSGDVIWDHSKYKWDDRKYNPEQYLKKSNLKSLRMKNMTEIALLATEANKDLWASFIRTMSKPHHQRRTIALKEANQLVNSWLAIDEQESKQWYNNIEKRAEDNYVLNSNDRHPKYGINEDQCMRNIVKSKGVSRADKIKKIKNDRRTVLYNIEPYPGYSDKWDPYMKIPYYWKWRTELELELIKTVRNPVKAIKLLVNPTDFNKALEYASPKEGYKIPENVKDQDIKYVKIKSALINSYMSTGNRIKNNQKVYIKKENSPAIQFLMIGDKNNFYLRVPSNPNLFLSFRGTCKIGDGQMKLFNESRTINELLKMDYVNFKLEPKGENNFVKSLSCSKNYIFAEKNLTGWGGKKTKWVKLQSYWTEKGKEALWKFEFE